MHKILSVTIICLATFGCASTELASHAAKGGLVDDAPPTKAPVMMKENQGTHVQVGAYASQQTAYSVAQSLQYTTHSVYIQPVTFKKTLYRVRLDPIEPANASQALAYARRLGYSDAIYVR